MRAPPSNVTPLLGLSFALVVGVTDLMTAFLRGAGGLAEPQHVFAPLAATTAAALLGFAVVWGTVWVLRRREPAQVLLPATAAVCVFILLGGLLDLLPPSALPKSQTHGALLGKAVMLALFSVLSGVLIGLVDRAWRETPHYGRRLGIVLVALPLLLAEFSALVWLGKYRIGLGVSVEAVLVIALFGVGLVATLFAARALPHAVRWMVLAGVLVPVLVIPAVVTSSPSRQRPDVDPQGPRHVLLLLSDTLRPDVLSCYGGRTIRTSNIDRLAADGVLFERVAAPSPWTLPSMASIMTGVSPLTHLAKQGGDRVPDQLATVAERFREAGFVTAAIGINPILRRICNLCQGFAEYDWFPRPEYDAHTLGATLLRWLSPDTWRSDLTSTELTDRCLDWYARHRNESTFLWLHYFDPHIPYAPPPRFAPAEPPPSRLGPAVTMEDIQRVRMGYVGRTKEERDWIRKLYLAEVRYVDEEIGRLLDGLQGLGLYEEMIIVFTSDHGEEFWEHGGFEHGHTLYDELLHVPLVVKAPAVGGGSRREDLVSSVDILPTLMDLTGLPPDPRGLFGRSLFPATTPRPVLSAAPLYDEEREAVVTPDRKYIRSLVSGHEELYDLKSDPEERHNLAAQDAGGMRAMRGLLQDLRVASQALRATHAIDSSAEHHMDPATRERLRSLGYVE